jgi:ribosomal-protein-alanine N-acetyltransferase
MNFTLRALHPADAPAAAKLHALAFPDPWSAAVFASWFADPAAITLGNFEDEELVTFVLLSAVLGEADILTLATNPARRNEGLARDLLMALIATLTTRGVHRLTLDVAEDNTPARRLYERLGFTLDGRRKGYYAAGRTAPVDALLMSCSLTV